MTTEQVIILAFLAAAFVAGWIARAVVGGRGRVDAVTLPALEIAVGPPPSEVEAQAPASLGQRLEGAVRESRQELARANRAYHAAVVRSLRDSDNRSGAATLEVLAGALVALSGAVDHASRELEAHNPLNEKLRGMGLELRRLADDVMRHSREPELPTGVLDRLEQHLISAASMIFASDRLQPRAS